MALDLIVVWNVLDKLLEAGNDFVEAQVAKTETEFDDNALITVELGLRDKLIKIYTLEKFPLD